MKKAMQILLVLVVVIGFWMAREVMAGQTEKVAGDGQLQVVESSLNGKKIDLTIADYPSEKLLAVLERQEVRGWWAGNVLKLAIRRAVAEGVSVNTLVLMFLFPTVAAVVAFSRQVVGMNGFGMILTSLLSVAFMSTGGLVGLVLLVFILGAAVFGRMVIRRLKLPYLPKLAVLIWLVSVLVLAVLIMSPSTGLSGLADVGILPIVVFVLLAETFVEAQITRSMSTSLGMTAETVFLAYVAYLVMSSVPVQTVVLMHPEVSVLGILIADILIGRYKGLRLSEVWRFRKMLAK